MGQWAGNRNKSERKRTDRDLQLKSWKEDNRRQPGQAGREEVKKKGLFRESHWAVAKTEQPQWDY